MAGKGVDARNVHCHHACKPGNLLLLLTSKFLYTMKKVILSSYGICAILAGGLLFSCSKDKDKETPAKRILGLWNIVREAEINKNTSTGVYSDTAFNDPITPGVVTGE